MVYQITPFVRGSGFSLALEGGVSQLVVLSIGKIRNTRARSPSIIPAGFCKMIGLPALRTCPPFSRVDIRCFVVQAAAPTPPPHLPRGPAAVRPFWKPLDGIYLFGIYLSLYFCLVHILLGHCPFRSGYFHVVRRLFRQVMRAHQY